METPILKKLNFSNRYQLPVILQSEASECGLACLCMIANYYGHNFDLISLRRSYPVSLKGATLKQILGVASMLSFSGRTIKFGFIAIKNGKNPLDTTLGNESFLSF